MMLGYYFNNRLLINLNCCRFSGGEGNATKIRNAAVVNATKHTRGDIDVAKKREELQRRIEETRRKLQSVSNDLRMKKNEILYRNFRSKFNSCFCRSVIDRY